MSRYSLCAEQPYKQKSSIYQVKSLQVDTATISVRPKSDDLFRCGRSFEENSRQINVYRKPFGTVTMMQQRIR